MAALLWTIKTIGGPGSLGFLITGVIAGLAASRIYSRSRLPRIWLAFLVIYYVISSTPAVSESVAASLPQIDRVGHVPPDCPHDTLTVLGGDNYQGRVREAARITSVCDPPHVLVSDAPWFAARVEEAGIPQARMTIDAKSRTTREQMQMVDEYVRGKAPRSVAVLASTLQMPRVAELAQHSGVDVILLISPLDDERVPGPARRMFPSFSALNVTYDALYEHIALVYYRHQGWID